MPVHRVKINGKEGWQYGQTGKVYYGQDARRKAEAQAAAIHASQNKKASITYREVLEKMAAAQRGIKIPYTPAMQEFKKLMRPTGYNFKPRKQEKPKNETVIDDPNSEHVLKITWSKKNPARRMT